MIRSGRIAAAFWRRSSGTRREAVASGSLHCACGKETRVFVFRAQTKRRSTSPDLVAYAVHSETGDAAEQSSDPVRDDGVSTWTGPRPKAS